MLGVPSTDGVESPWNCMLGYVHLQPTVVFENAVTVQPTVILRVF